MTVLRQTEKQFQQAVEDYARLNGWLVFHPYDSRRSEPGYPDLTMVRDNRVIFAELKREGGRLTAAQQRWIDALDCSTDFSSNVDVYVWRPSDWPDIELTLGRGYAMTRAP